MLFHDKVRANWLHRNFDVPASHAKRIKHSELSLQAPAFSIVEHLDVSDFRLLVAQVWKTMEMRNCKRNQDELKRMQDQLDALLR